MVAKCEVNNLSYESYLFSTQAWYGSFQSVCCSASQVFARIKISLQNESLNTRVEQKKIPYASPFY